MSRSIFKFPINPSSPREGGRFEVEMPRGAIILYAREQGERICVWAIVDPQAEKVKRRLLVIGTGWDIPDELSIRSLPYLGSAHLHEGALVFHVFDAGEV